MPFKQKWVAFILLTTIACTRDKPLPNNASIKSKANKVVVVIIDGPRYTETFGDSSHKHIPALYELSKKGTLLTNFYNNGITNTMNGLVAISTGNYQNVSNSNDALPLYSSFLHHWMQTYNIPSSKAWVISSKDKTEALCLCGSCSNNYNKPFANCGNAGLNTGYRSDAVTYSEALNTFIKYHPVATIVHFKEPDVSGHLGNWGAYLLNLNIVSSYTKSIYETLQNDPFYKDQTAFFITNDHGRHLDGIADGFISHGDNCEGCKHISLVAVGPDFKANFVDTNTYAQIDVAATINKMFDLQMQLPGKVITSLFNK